MTDRRNVLLSLAEQYHADFNREYAVFTGDMRIRRAATRILEQDGVSLPKAEPIAWYGSLLFMLAGGKLHRMDMSKDIFESAYRGEL